MLTCNAADETPRDVLDYRKKERERVREDILETLKHTPATVAELARFIGKVVIREITFHYDKETGYTCYGHLGDIHEANWQPEIIRRNMTALCRLGLVEYLDGDKPPYLWYARSL